MSEYILTKNVSMLAIQDWSSNCSGGYVKSRPRSSADFSSLENGRLDKFIITCGCCEKTVSPEWFGGDVSL